MKINSFIKFLLAVTLFGLFVFFVSEVTKETTDKEPINIQDTIAISQVETISEEDKVERDKALLKSEIAAFDSIPLDPFLTSVENIQLGMQYFEKAAADVRLAESYSNKDINNYGKILKNKLIRKQKIWYPKYRKAYSNIMANKVWENDVYVTASGSNNTIFNLSGGIFAANKNIKDMQESIYDILYSLRFKQSRYRWYKGADEFTYYTIDSKQDSEL